MSDSSIFGIIATIFVCMFLFSISSSLKEISLSLQGFDVFAEAEKQDRVKTERRKAVVDWLRKSRK